MISSAEIIEVPSSLRIPVYCGCGPRARIPDQFADLEVAVATSSAKMQRNTATTPAAELQRELNEKGVADVMVSLTTAALAASAPAKAMAVGVGGGASLGFASATQNVTDVQLPGDLLSCFETDYQETSGPLGMSLSLTVPPIASGARTALSYRSPEVAPVLYLNKLGVVLGSVSSRGLRELQHHQMVNSVRPVPELTLVRPQRIAAAEPATEITWGLKRLNIRKLWDQGLDGDGIKIGHLDTGVDGNHPMLKDAFSAFAEFNYIGKPVFPDPAPHDTDRHGTHTAGTIVGREVMGNRMGVAPKARLASAIVIEGGKTTYRILGGINWALQQGVRVLSMSLGLPGNVDDFLGIIRTVRESGVLVIVAIGNEGRDTSRSPGNYRAVLSVGAIDEKDGVATFSSSQGLPPPKGRVVPDLVGPGVGVVSAAPGGRFASMDGTSMAAPHIAGLAALLFQAKPAATPDQVEKAIFASCKRDKTMSRDRANRGVPDAAQALRNL